MREIKFRLRNSVNKIVGYEKWYVGSLDSKNFYVAKPCWLYSEDDKTWNPSPIQHRHKDQYTDFKDKNGKEIYAGDIVKCGMGDWVGIIEYIKGAYLIDNRLWLHEYRGNIEVIGNIYENKEV